MLGIIGNVDIETLSIFLETFMRYTIITFFSTLLFTPSVFAGLPTSCPYSPSELGSALGGTFKEGKVGFESDFGTGKTLSCRYEGKDMTFVVNQTVMKNPTQTQGWDTRLAGKKENVPNDPDGAVQQTDQGDNTNPNLHYARNGDIVELRVMGVGKRNPQFGTLQKILPTLRRLP
jgi:hypothetical protein